ncbi:hypothetical protein [Kitasatospora sp. CB02891]|uniref:hypothetical protein n=1 Tax=Kitasatospora sp. CB02891 TaxID=2020329 RepID=UPI000C27805F|nr:hypothetical protein [Kitasatospora sp. CB02891]PJN25424.1 hypothetical protein CG736_13495 [Kitasatospora sp. CB02891]
MTGPDRSFDAQVRDGNAYQAGRSQTIDNSHTVHHYDSGRGRGVLGAVAVLSVSGPVFGLYQVTRHEERPAPPAPGPAVTAQGSSAAPPPHPSRRGRGPSGSCCNGAGSASSR